MRRFPQFGMKFLDQTGFPYTGLAHDQHELAITVARPLPAPHQQVDFFLATDKRREMALTSATSTPACSYKPKQRYRLRHAFQFMAAALLGDKQTSDLPLHARGDHHRTWLCERLHPRRRVGCIAV